MTHCVHKPICDSPLKQQREKYIKKKKNLGKKEKFKY